MERADKELIQGYLSGEVSALELLVDRYKKQLFGYIMNMTRNPHEADEVFQEVWLKVIRKLSRYRDKNFLGWLVRIAHNCIIDRARKRKPARSLDEVGPDGETLGATLSTDMPGPDGLAEMGELGRQIEDAVSTLPADQKEVFLMRVKAGLPFKEIARVQRTSINTALARMQYALAKLRTLLREEYAGA